LSTLAGSVSAAGSGAAESGAAPSGLVYQLDHVTFAYNNQVALRDVSLNIAAGEQIAILGANGSGKSTLLRLLDGLCYAGAGVVQAFGHPLSESALADDSWAYGFRRRVGLVFQDPDVQLFSPTVWDEVIFAPLHLGLPPAEVRERAEWALALLGIEKLRERAPHRLSGGEKKKVALASILSLQPDVWLMDEPTASLDPRSQSRLLDFVGQLAAAGKTVITATHQLDIVSEIAGRAIVFCEDHRITADGPPAAVLADRARLVECNLVYEHRHRHGEIEHAHPHLSAHEHHQPEA
jgi:cobalt/nickel transport system ATP-binding protein